MTENSTAVATTENEHKDFGTKIFKCIVCDREFPFTKREAEWMAERFGDNYAPPKRCKACRHIKPFNQQLSTKLVEQGKRAEEPLFMRGRSVQTYHPRIDTKNNRRYI
jgi:hypothetical protein